MGLRGGYVVKFVGFISKIAAIRRRIARGGTLRHSKTFQCSGDTQLGTQNLENGAVVSCRKLSRALNPNLTEVLTTHAHRMICTLFEQAAVSLCYYIFDILQCYSYISVLYQLHCTCAFVSGAALNYTAGVKCGG